MSIGFGGNIIPGGPPPPCEGIIIPPGGGIIIPKGGIPGCFISKGLCGCALPNGGKEDPSPPELMSNYMATNCFSLSLSFSLYSNKDGFKNELLLLFSSVSLGGNATQTQRNAFVLLL